MEPFIVETAELSPRACVGCWGNIGPFVDVGEVEIPTVNGPIPFHVYLCKRVCARSVARVSGFAPGKKMNELANAAEQLAQKEKELAEVNEANKILRSEAANRAEAIGALQSAYDQAQGRVAQLELVIGEKARAELALVGGDAV
jgi:hypothetical protein